MRCLVRAFGYFPEALCKACLIPGAKRRKGSQSQIINPPRGLYLVVNVKCKIDIRLFEDIKVNVCEW